MSHVQLWKLMTYLLCLQPKYFLIDYDFVEDSDFSRYFARFAKRRQHTSAVSSPIMNIFIKAHNGDIFSIKLLRRWVWSISGSYDALLSHERQEIYN